MTDKTRTTNDGSQKTAEAENFSIFMVGLSMVLAVVPLVLSVALSVVILGGDSGPLSIALFNVEQAEARETREDSARSASAAETGDENPLIAGVGPDPQGTQASPDIDASRISDEADPRTVAVQASEVAWETDDLTHEAGLLAPEQHELSNDAPESEQEPSGPISEAPKVSAVSEAPAEPVNADEEPDPIGPLARPVAEPVADSLVVNLLTPRGRAPEYKVDETLEVTVTVSEDAYLYCYYRDGSGAVYRVFPNEFQPDAHMGPGRPVVIPGEGSDFEIVLDQPHREEELGCLASREDIDAALSQALRKDLVPLPVKTIDEVVDAVLRIDPAASEARLRILVEG